MMGGFEDAAHPQRLWAPWQSIAGTSKLWHYWMGIANTTAGWRWPDGTMASGYVSNANPYAHWYNTFQATWVPSDCIFGHLSYPYSR
jgi:hypothetical protein